MSPPSSRPPAGVPQGGNAKYAIVAAVLLIGIVALVALRTCSKPAESGPSLAATTTASQVAPPPPTNPKLDDIPPPPPPEEIVEAGPAGPRIVAASGPPPGCDSRCSPSYATAELQAAINLRGQQARRCYNQALSRDPSLKGHVNIAVRIGPSGNVCSANVASNDMSSPAVAQCAANIFRVATYPAPRGGCVEANVPLSFVAQGQ
jgi:hypothetical protein